jgi:hypothetical protein
VRKLGMALACATAMALAGQASASVVYQSIPDLAADPITNGYCSPCTFATFQSIGQAFTLSTAQTLTSASFAVSGLDNWPSPVEIGIYTNAGGIVFHDWRTELAIPAYLRASGSGGGIVNTLSSVAPGVAFNTTSFEDAGVILSSSAVPEPSMWAMMILGFFGIGAALRSRAGPAWRSS